MQQTCVLNRNSCTDVKRGPTHLFRSVPWRRNFSAQNLEPTLKFKGLSRTCSLKLHSFALNHQCEPLQNLQAASCRMRPAPWGSVSVDLFHATNRQRTHRDVVKIQANTNLPKNMESQTPAPVCRFRVSRTTFCTRFFTRFSFLTRHPLLGHQSRPVAKAAEANGCPRNVLSFTCLSQLTHSLLLVASCYC